MVGVAIAAILIGLIFGVGMYVLVALSQVKLYEKANHPDAWMAWIPVLNMFPMMDLIGRRRVEIWLVLIPFVGSILTLLWMMELFRAYGQNPWVAFLPLIPALIVDVLNIAAPHSIVASVFGMISGVASLIYVIYLIRMGFSSEVQYQGYPKRFY